MTVDKKLIKEIVNDIGGIPTDYLCLDSETTGFKKNDDLIVALGHCSVTDCQADTFEYKVLNWADFDQSLVPIHWLEQKLNSCRYWMEKNGRSYHGVTIELMRERGYPPLDVFEEYLELMQTAVKNGQELVGHNLAHFDKPRIEYALAEYIGAEYNLPEELIFDTAAIEKASICGMVPHAGEHRYKYFKRVLAAARAGVNYKLDLNCVPKYQLAEKYDLDLDQAHVNPGFDAMLCHLLAEEFREIAGC